MKKVGIPELIKAHKVLSQRNAHLEDEIKSSYKLYIAKKEDVELRQYLFDKATNKYEILFAKDVSFQKYVEIRKKFDELLTLYVKAKDVTKNVFLSSLVVNKSIEQLPNSTFSEDKSAKTNITTVKNQILEYEKTLSQFSNHEFYKRAYLDYSGWEDPLNSSIKECEKRKSIVIKSLEEHKSNYEKIGEIRTKLDNLMGKEKLNKKLPYKEKQLGITF